MTARLAARAARAVRVKELAGRLKTENVESQEAEDLLFAAGRFWTPLIRWAHDQAPTGKFGVPSQAYLQVWIDRAERILEVPSSEDDEVVAAPDDPTPGRRFPFKKAIVGVALLFVAVGLAGALAGDDTEEAATGTGTPEPIVAATDSPADTDEPVAGNEPDEAASTQGLVTEVIEGLASTETSDLRELTSEGDSCSIELACSEPQLDDVLVILDDGDPPAGKVGVFAYDETTAAAVAGDKTGTFWCASLDSQAGTTTYGSGESSEAALLDCSNAAWD